MDFAVGNQSLCWIFVVCTFVVLHQLWQQRRLSKDIPWVGSSKSPFLRFLPQLKVLLHGHDMLQESYYKYGKANQACFLPNIFGSPIMLPPSLISWLLKQPEDVLSSKYAQIDAMEATHTMLRPEVVLQPVHEKIVQRDLKNHLNVLAPKIQDEISHAVDEFWGTETESFTMVNLDATIRRIVTRASNRAFVDLPLCRDPVFTENAIKYVDSIPVSALLLKLCPPSLRSYAAKVTSLGSRFFYSRCAQHLQPYFANRIMAWRHDPTTLHDNFADWSVRDAMGRDNPAEKTPDMLSRRLMTLNFAAIHTSTMTITNMIIDMTSGPAGEKCLSAIVDECQVLRRKYGSKWSSTRIAEMVVTDSALRESMRISGFGSKAFVRKVIDPAGMIVPDGIHIPHGNIVCVSGYSMHRDEDIYPNSLEFCHNRFLHALDSVNAEQRLERTLSKAATTTGVEYAVWGHGKHACPGRFFAVHLVKMVVAYMVENYDLQSWDERPANVWIGDTPIPPRNLMIGIRRRQKDIL